MIRTYRQWVWFVPLVVSVFVELPSVSAAPPSDSASAVLPIIPRPMLAVWGQGTFSLDRTTAVRVQPATRRMHELAGYLSDRLDSLFGIHIREAIRTRRLESRGSIRMTLIPANDSISGEGYMLTVTHGTVDVRAASDAGILYAIQSLLELVRSEEKGFSFALSVPCVRILDAPRFRWRGAHLDVSRHFFPVSFVKKYIDVLAMHKLNVFHWHLTDDQGWRIEIRKYPRLTEVGAWRADRGDLPWDICEPQRPGEKATYGGFYTQDELRDVVQYAARRCITIVPEIEMPAHCQAALAAYPEYSCSGGPFSVPTGHIWPDTNIFCAGNDATFGFIEAILTEVMGIFPGPYIHIGGDEADKTVWKKCPKCQARIVSEGLSGVSELQSYFVKRIEKFLGGRGRRLVGWDEILEGGLAPEATVMSWRGVAGGIAAARAGHDVVMSPTTTCYFDYYQGDAEYEPLAIGGYLPITTVYSFEPVPDSLTAAEGEHVLGGQANIWTEYIPTPNQAEYMLLPRLAALAEVVWSPKASRQWPDFARRLAALFMTYDRAGWHYARAVLRAHASTLVDTIGKSVCVSLGSDMPDQRIRYTTDGSAVGHDSPLYKDTLRIDRSMSLHAAAYSGSHKGVEIAQTFVRDRASFSNVEYINPYSRHFPANGRFALTDMARGGTAYESGRWQGFSRQDLDVIVDLGTQQRITRITTGFLRDMPNNIFFPDSVLYEVSTDGRSFTSLPVVVNTLPQNQIESRIQDFTVAPGETEARYIHVRAKNIGICPPWHPSAGKDAWLLADEIIVE